MNEGWTEADDVRLAHFALPEDHPVRVFYAFSWLHTQSPLPTPSLEKLVTPESRKGFGDFSASREWIVDQSYGVSGIVPRARDAVDIAYVKLVDPAHNMSIVIQPRVVGWVTLVWRPELGGWRIHCIGDLPGLPELMPRTTPNEAPAYDTDETPPPGWPYIPRPLPR